MHLDQGRCWLALRQAFQVILVAQCLVFNSVWYASLIIVIIACFHMFFLKSSFVQNHFSSSSLQDCLYCMLLSTGYINRKTEPT